MLSDFHISAAFGRKATGVVEQVSETGENRDARLDTEALQLSLNLLVHWQNGRGKLTRPFAD